MITTPPNCFRQLSQLLFKVSARTICQVQPFHHPMAHGQKLIKLNHSLVDPIEGAKKVNEKVINRMTDIKTICECKVTCFCRWKKSQQIRKDLARK